MISFIYFLYGEERVEAKLAGFISLFLMDICKVFIFKNPFVIYGADLLFLIALIDFKDMIIPNLSLLFFIPIINFNFNLDLDSVLSIFFIVTALILSMFTDSLGVGDAKLFILLFLVMGSGKFVLLILYLSFLLFIFSLCFVFYRKSKNFPLAPFIFFAYLMTEVGFI